MEHPKPSGRPSFRTLWREKKAVTITYILLRTSVVLVMLAQIFNRNFENVFLCVLTMGLFMMPSVLERKLDIDLPNTLEIIILLFMLAIATLAYFGALTFAESLGEPIAALDKAAKEVSEGNLDQKIDEDIGWGEFKNLITSFNKMTADLKDYQALQLQAQLSQMKEDLFRAVAHDLRAPLLGLQGYIYILSSGKASQEEEKEYLRLMSQAAANLSALLEDVLDVSRLEAGMLNPSFKEVDLQKLAREAADTVAPSAQEKKLELTVQVPSVSLQADEKLLRRVLVNLLSNAIKFTQEGFVRLEAKKEKSGVSITVQDSGMGIDPKDQQTIFEKYHQVRSDSRGYGLGLFISRQIVCAHGGDIQVSSEPGKGSTFTVRLPKEKK